MVIKNNAHRFLVLLVTGAIFAAGLSLYIGRNQSVWFDEAYSILLAKHSWTDIIRLTAQDVHPPFYYWLLKTWMMFFGSNELALRSLSAFFLALSIIMSGLIVRKVVDARTALIMLPFVVFAPFLLRYGFEIRMYALCSFLGLAATYALLFAVEEKNTKKRNKFLVLYALLVAIGTYTLYFMVLVWMAHCVWIGWKIYRGRRYDLLRPLIASYGFAVLLFMPWLPIFIRSAGAGSLSPVTRALGVENMYGIVTFLFLYRPSWDDQVSTTIGVIGVVGTTAFLSALAYKKASASEKRLLGILSLYFLIPILVLAIVTHIKPIYLERYLAHYAIAAYMSVGVLAAISIRTGGKIAKVTAGVLLVVLFFGSSNLYTNGNYNFQRVHKPAIRQASESLAECSNGVIIFADEPQTAMEFMYYLDSCPVYFFNKTAKMGGGFAMLSDSPLRIGNIRDFPQAKKVFHLYYDKPNQKLPEYLRRQSVTAYGPLNVAEYRQK